jgi:pimeloyl-ACP methyl ester carboxylesterase
MEPVLLSRGFALAGSAFRANGWDVREGIEDTLALREFFIQQVGRPRRTILWGLSLGAMIAARSMEETPRAYDGAICVCMPGAGATRTWDKVLDLSLAYDAALGWPNSWGTVRLVAPGVDYEKEVAPEITRQFKEKDWLARFEFVRASLGAGPEDFYKTPAGSPALLILMFFATEGRAELQTRAGGLVGQNLGRRYGPSAEVWAYLSSLGAKAEWLDEMNAKTIAPDAKARAYLARNADFSGRVEAPVLSIHTIVDSLVSPAHESAYRDTLKSAGREALLVQTFTNGVGHCLFSEAQLGDAVAAMESWIESGTPPAADAFPGQDGFVRGFRPPPWQP